MSDGGRESDLISERVRVSDEVAQEWSPDATHFGENRECTGGPLVTTGSVLEKMGQTAVVHEEENRIRQSRLGGAEFEGPTRTYLQEPPSEVEMEDVAIAPSIPPLSEDQGPPSIPSIDVEPPAFPDASLGTVVGAYLVYSADSLGTLLIHWSKTPVEAVAFFAPGKSVPAFQFTTNFGKTVLLKGVDQRGKFAEGWLAYVKLAFFKFQATGIDMCQHMPKRSRAREFVKLVTLQKTDNKVEHFGQHTEEGTVPGCQARVWTGVADEILAFAILPVNDTSLDIKSMQVDLFIQKGQKGGASARR